MNKICVFCGSSRGFNSIYSDQANLFGKYLASQNIDLVYGGGKVGIMGVVAESILKNGGNVYGVITKQLYDKEVGYDAISKLHIVSTMHERKAMMERMSDGFVALPGGVGTLDEIIEIFTWSQLSIHKKPFGFLNINNYFANLFDFFRTMQKDGFLHPEYLERLISSEDPEELISKFRLYEHQPVRKWL